MSVATAIGGGHDKWGTPQDLFDEIRAKYFNHIPFDPCPNFARLLEGTFTDSCEQDALTADHVWREEELFINPPFSDIEPWVKKADSVQGRKIVLLLPARTDSKWFQEYGRNAEIVFIKGRVNYVDINSTKKSSASFGSMLMIFGGGTGIDFWRPKCHQQRRGK